MTEKSETCGRKIWSTVIAWGEQDQIDPCRCVLPKGHAGHCQCKHEVGEEVSRG